MIKRLITVVLFSALAAIHAAGQNRFPPINLVPGDPTGTACQPHAMVQSSDSGLLYTCQGGVFHGSSPVEPARVSWPPECNAPGMVYNIATNTCTDISHVPPANVAWPPSCTTGTYVPASNTCVPTGTAANPGGSPGQTQINAGGGTFVGIPGSVTDVTNGWKTQGGTQYAKGWQSGGGNNGIANAQAANATIVVDPTYGTTEPFSPYLYSASPLHIQDQRTAQTTNFYRNPVFTYFNFGIYPANVNMNAATSTYCNYDLTGNPGKPQCGVTGMHNFFPGYSYGNPGGGVTVSGWTTVVNQQMVTESRNAGIAETINILQNKTGVGDNAPLYVTDTGYGGSTGASDESNKAIAFNLYEGTDGYSGTCATGCTNGSTQLKTTPTVVGGTPINTQGVGRYLINGSATGASVLGGNVTAVAASSIIASMEAVTVDATMSGSQISNAWGKLVSVINTPVNFAPPFTTSQTFTINSLGGAGFNDTGLLCFQGNFHEQAYPVPGSVSTTAGVTTMTVLLRRPHVAGSAIMQGGMCGTGLEFTAYTYVGANSGQTPAAQMYLIDIVGSTDANTLQVEWFYRGGTMGFPSSSAGQIGTILGFQNVTTATVSYGTTVYLTLSGGAVSLYSYPATSLVLSGMSDPLMNDTCTGVVFTDTTHATCTIATLTGNRTNANGGAKAMLGINGFNAYPIAEVLDVRNNTLNPPQVDGTFTLEPNVLQITSGTLMKEINHQSSQWQGATMNTTLFNPYTAASNGLSVSLTGHGSQGGTAAGSSNTVLNLLSTSGSSYVGSGGYQYPPNGITLSGSYYYGMLIPNMPAPDQAILGIGIGGVYTNPNLKYSLWRWDTKPGTWTKTVNPYYGDVTETVPRINTIGGSIVMIQNPTFGTQTNVGTLNFANVPSPTLTVVGSSSGGTLANGSYCYYILARDTTSTFYSNPAATETCGTVSGGSGTGSVTLSWPPVAAANGYLIYGRSPGAEGFLITLSGITTNSYVDAGVPGNPAVSIPAGKQTLPGISNAQSVGFNSGSTAIQANVVAPGVAAGGTVTNGSANVVITSGSLVGVAPGFTIGGYGIPAGTTVLSVLGTTVTMSANATKTQSNEAVNIGMPANINLTLPGSTGTLGLGIPLATGTATFTAGTNVTSCVCAASYTCTNSRGRLTIVGGTATTGTICTLNWSANLGAAPFFTLGEMGATSLHGLDHGVPTATAVAITAASSISGATITLDYERSPSTSGTVIPEDF